MYYNIDLEDFGKEMRRIRTNLGLTRSKITEDCGISEETIRLIENGSQIPKVITLHLLSAKYNIDLIALLNQYMKENILTTIHNNVDSLLTRHNLFTGTLSDYYIKDEDILACNYIDTCEVKQFNSVLEALEISSSNKKEDDLKAIDILTKSLKNNHPDFCLDDLESNFYTFVELRSLFLIGVFHATTDDLTTSDRIFEYLYKRFSSYEYHDHLTKNLYIKLLGNMSYNSHRHYNHSDAIRLADEAIKVCNENNSSYLLEFLLYRKGIAEYLLGNDQYVNSLKLSRAMFEIKELDSKLKEYLAFTKELYNIEF